MSEVLQFILMSAGAFVLAALIIAGIAWLVLRLTIFADVESAQNQEILNRYR